MVSEKFFNNEITVMIGGILAGGFISFGVFLIVGFICVKVRRRPLLQQQHNLSQNNHCNLNGSTNGVSMSQNKNLLQVSFLQVFLPKSDF